MLLPDRWTDNQNNENIKLFLQKHPPPKRKRKKEEIECETHKNSFSQVNYFSSSDLPLHL